MHRDRQSTFKWRRQAQSITTVMMAALCDRLAENPDMDRDDMVDFLRNEYYTIVIPSGIGRVL
jgi:hypothetical protein